MSKLNIDQKNIINLFSEKKTDFLIPDYQRPYAWEEKECQTLWEDILSFAFPDNDVTKFNPENDEYFLGPIVTFKNNNKMEIIDGQQRLTTLMLLLRAFYSIYGNMRDTESIETSKKIARCIWKTDEMDHPNKEALKIDSEVANDDEKEEFLTILKTGNADEKKSRYACNFRFFQNKIQEFLTGYPSYFNYLPIRILNNCILLPIEAESQDTALRIFSTLNDRGKPLSDADIFKAQFYKNYSKQGKKNDFIEKWKTLEEICNEIFNPIQGTPMDELFTRYMYYERAKQGNKSSTTEALRKFYEKKDYELLKREETLSNLIELANFWKAVSDQNDEKFSENVLRKLFVLNYAPNGMWTYFVSVYYMKNKDKDGLLNEEKFLPFLDKITAFIWSYAITNPGVNALRTPVYAEMLNIVNDKEVEFKDFLFERETLTNALYNHDFSNNRAITKSMLTWWAFHFEHQEKFPLEARLDIEHIFARKRQENDRELSDVKSLEILGNKSLLEKGINIRAADYRFSDKVKYYQGFTNAKGQKKNGTKIYELVKLSKEQSDFNEADIKRRNKEIIDGFIGYLAENGLLQ